jgi:hypothetical protein
MGRLADELGIVVVVIDGDELGGLLGMVSRGWTFSMSGDAPCAGCRPAGQAPLFT